MAESDPGERRAAGTGPGTKRGTERITEPGTERITEPGTRRGTELITGPGTRRGTERITGPGTEGITESGTGPGIERITVPGTEAGTAGWPRRPPYSFVALITMAIRASPGQRLPLSGIYAYIAERFPFYRGPGRQWQNSVRHNLSLNPCFRRLPCRQGRAGEWALDPAFQDMYPGGNYHLRRRRRLCRRPPASPPPPPGMAPGPAEPRAPPPSGIAPGSAEAPQLPELRPGPAALRAQLLSGMAPPPSGIAPGPAALRPPPPCPVPPGWPQGPWAALVLPRRYPQLPARSPAVPPALPLPAWALRPAEPGTAGTCELGTRLSPALR